MESVEKRRSLLPRDADVDDRAVAFDVVGSRRLVPDRAKGDVQACLLGRLPAHAADGDAVLLAFRRRARFAPRLRGATRRWPWLLRRRSASGARGSESEARHE